MFVKELLFLHHQITVTRILLCQDFISPPCPQQFLIVFHRRKKDMGEGYLSNYLHISKFSPFGW